LTHIECDSAKQLPDWRACRSWLSIRDFVLNLKAAKLGSAILIEGRKGVGKRQFVGMSLAAIFCESESACGSCNDCVAIAEGRHPEVLWCEGADQIRVEEVDTIQDHLSYKAQNRRRSQRLPRVAVIVGAERLNLNSANRLLKILEEPPEGSCVLFTCAHTKQLPMTVRSRLVRWRVQPPKAELSQPWLTQQLQLEGVDRPLPLVSAALRNFQFAPLQALEALRANRSEFLPHPELVQILSGGAPQDILARVEALAKQDKQSISHWVTEVELALNHCYRHNLRANPKASTDMARAARKRRQVLGLVKKTGVQAKIALNTQLVLETVGLAASDCPG
jgi:DNA polymerase-3 subunit delta'